MRKQKVVSKSSKCENIFHLISLKYLEQVPLVATT
jgi:hypothetical protein